MANGDSGDTKMAGGEAQDGALVRTVIAATLAGLFVIGLFLYNKWDVRFPLLFFAVVIGVVLFKCFRAQIFCLWEYMQRHDLLSATVTAGILAGVVFGVFLDAGMTLATPGDLRDIAGSLAAAIGIPFLIFRSIVHNKQAETDSQRRLTGDYAKFAELFASEFLSARLAGLYGLKNLAREKPEDFHVLVMGIICAFLRNLPTLKDWKGEEYAPPADRPDLLEAVFMICERTPKQIKHEKEQGFQFNLGSANLEGLDFRGIDFLRGAIFARANLKNTQFDFANLQGARFDCAELGSAVFDFADLRGAHLWDNSMPASMICAAINDTTFPLKYRDTHDLVVAAVVLTDAAGNVLDGFPKFLPDCQPCPVKNCPRKICAKWQAEREKWRQENLPPATRR
jgi:hypothetical protein